MAGLLSDYSGMSALTCAAMLGLACPTVSTSFRLNALSTDHERTRDETLPRCAGMRKKTPGYWVLLYGCLLGGAGDDFKD